MNRNTAGAIQAKVEWREQMAKEHEHEPKRQGKVESVERRHDAPDQDPPVAKLVKEKGPDGKNTDKPPVPPVAGGGHLPRLVSQNERAPQGTVRYKIRCDNYRPQPTRYILVKKGEDARQQAKDFYLKSTCLDQVVASLRETSAEPQKVELPALAVTELSD